ncbi:thioredoxin [Mesorhizobium xinjiangense]|uniref:thioredoxin n=1 Tax=Mesorhizobium xinjiangense TaxID=2678685 RepID=UPI0012EE75EC|nr:thioredoxin [Mesorhizobium xinjiangense]
MKDNPYAGPFAGPSGGYTTTTTFGGEQAGGEQADGEQAGATGESVAAQGQPVKDTTTADFAADVIEASRNQAVLVDFWAPWCGPCKQLTPILERLVAEANGAVQLVKMNIDEHPAIAGQLGIQSIPAVIAFKDGQPVDGFMGAQPESQVRDFIKRLGGPAADPVTEALEQAAAVRQDGDEATAARIYSAVLAQAPDNAAAAAGLASIHLDRGDIETARQIVDTIAADEAGNAALDSVRARIALEDEAAKLGDAGALRERLEADPKDHAARFDLALIHNARGERMDAADALLEIVRSDRDWREDGARMQLLKFFDAWGPTDQATLAARRKLSSLLFS